LSITLDQLAQHIHAQIVGPSAAQDAQKPVHQCAGLDSAGPQDVSFLANPKYLPKLATTQALAIIVSAADAQTIPDRTLLVAKDPYFAFRNAVVALHGFRQHPPAPPGPGPGPRSPLAVIHPEAQVHPSAIVHPFAVICEGATVGEGSVIYPHCFVGPHASLGQNCILYPNVVVYDHCILGNRVTLHAGCVIGQDGFGYATHQGAHHKIPQVGNVILEDDVELGANCAIDRATVGSTVIGKGTKTSNLVTVGHGSRVGQHNLLVALVGLAGSVETGNYVAMGGQVGVAGHLRIGNMVQIAATSGVMDDIPDGQKVGGTPAISLTEAKRLHLSSLRLPDLIAKVKRLEREIEKLKSTDPKGPAI
jgi:UDP-3-O-[3-hydroxymyristoyl] glucosamine N-acyltransferase